MLRTCKTCKAETPIEDFTKANGRYTYMCKLCKNKLNKFYREKVKAKDPETYYTKSRAYRKNKRAVLKRDNPDLLKAMDKNRTLKTDFGITLDDFYKMMEDQNGLCKICNKPSPFTLAVDHCHNTGIIRGLLCINCNRALGLISEEKQTLLNMVEYLKLN